MLYLKQSNASTQPWLISVLLQLSQKKKEKKITLDSLLLFVKLLQIYSLLILPFYSIFLHFTMFCLVLKARFQPPLSPLKPRRFVDACITAGTSL